MKRGIVIALFLSVSGAGVARAQEVIEVTPAQGLTGVTNTTAGTEVQVYAVQLRDNVANVRTAQLGPTPGANGITLTLSDLTAPTGLAAGDFTELRLYRSTDAVFDGGDTFMKAASPVGIGATTLLDVSGVAPATLKDIPDVGAVPNSVYFIITAVVSAGATVGHAFRVGAAANHINIHESGGGAPSNYSMGSAITAADANRVVIVSATSASGSIPVMPPALYGLLALCVLGYGIYSLKRR